MLCRFCPLHPSLGDLPQTEFGAGGLVDVQLCAGADLFEERFGLAVVQLCQRVFGFFDFLAAKFVGLAVQAVFEIGDAFLRLFQGFFRFA